MKSVAQRRQRISLANMNYENKYDSKVELILKWQIKLS